MTSDLTPETLDVAADEDPDIGGAMFDRLHAHADAWRDQLLAVEARAAVANMRLAACERERDEWHYSWAQDTMASHYQHGCSMCVRAANARDRRGDYPRPDEDGAL